MINLYIVLGILFWHWVADFVWQSDYQAKNKSNSWDALLSHTILYTISWGIPLLVMVVTNPNITLNLLWFFPITFVAHTATDYYTSRVNKILWDDQKVHQFFVSIGFDQFLHFSQLLFTYYLLIK